VKISSCSQEGPICHVDLFRLLFRGTVTLKLCPTVAFFLTVKSRQNFIAINGCKLILQQSQRLVRICSVENIEKIEQNWRLVLLFAVEKGTSMRPAFIPEMNSEPFSIGSALCQCTLHL
jgi:hypothetical protein